ncbi:hypothetical protein [Aquimarina latercula]|uniref:hypothetical protein n=1 Tax=Aquimarina latercula TaxID=987 RepID=UPI00040FEB7C|nr:hypothetical protein [Aquimarina latercula]
MKTIKTILETHKIKRETLITIKGGNNNSSNTSDEDAIGNQMRPRTGMFGG